QRRCHPDAHPAGAPHGRPGPADPPAGGCPMNAALNRPPLSAGRVIRAVLVVLLALAWLAPTVGLLVTSLRPQSDIAASGWWTVVTAPRFTFDNYGSVLTAR